MLRRDDGLALPFAVTLANDTLGMSGWPVARWSPVCKQIRRYLRLSRAKPSRNIQRGASPRGKPDGSLWVGLVHAGKGGGLQQLAQGTWETIHHSGVRCKYARGHSVAIRPRQLSWIGTLNRGIYRIQGNMVDHFRGSDGLSGDAVSGLFQDREGNIWIVTSRGSIISMTFAWLAFPHGKG